MRYLMLALLPVLALAEPPPELEARIIPLQIGGALVCWRVTIADGPALELNSWHAICVPADQGRVCVETDTNLRCPRGATAPQAPPGYEAGSI